MRRLPHFVPAQYAGSRKDTAVLLVGTAREFGISQHDIQSAQRGFLISQRLQDVLYDGDATDTSGNRAAKKNSKKERA